MKTPLLFLVSMAITACAVVADAAGIPTAAHHYERDLTRIVQQVWGLPAPVSIHASQIHQESHWRADVDSPVGAQGLAQFMPGTSAWIVEAFPELGQATPYSPGWAMRAQVRYNRWHWARITAIDDCQRWAMTLSAYNGGLGWVYRDQELAANAGADPAVWFDSVERYTRRADWARSENRYYVEHILIELTPRYARAGWQGSPPCSPG